MRSNINPKARDGRRLLANEVFDEQTRQQLEVASRAHPIKHKKIRARKRYKKASPQAQAGIDEAIKDRRLRRLKALWDPEGNL